MSLLGHTETLPFLEGWPGGGNGDGRQMGENSAFQCAEVSACTRVRGGTDFQGSGFAPGTAWPLLSMLSEQTSLHFPDAP